MAINSKTDNRQLLFSLLALIGVLATVCNLQVDAQFFTKSSSKSIPRMGRRSDSSLGPSKSLLMSRHPMRRSAIDNLLDEFGPGLIDALEAGQRSRSNGFGGEVAYRNEQPIDSNLVRFAMASPHEMTQENEPDYGPSSHLEYNQRAAGQSVIGSRDERSLPAQRTSDSLVMRALNLDRLMQHLNSGGQPLMSYDKLLNGQQSRLMTNSNGDDDGKRQLDQQQKLQELD